MSDPIETLKAKAEALRAAQVSTIDAIKEMVNTASPETLLRVVEVLAGKSEMKSPEPSPVKALAPIPTPVPPAPVPTKAATDAVLIGLVTGKVPPVKASVPGKPIGRRGPKPGAKKTGRPSLKVATAQVLLEADAPMNAEGVLESLEKRAWVPESNDPLGYIRYTLSSCSDARDPDRIFDRTPGRRGYYQIAAGYSLKAQVAAITMSAPPSVPVLIQAPSKPAVDTGELIDIERDILNLLSVSPRKSSVLAEELDQDSYTVVRHLKRLQHLDRVQAMESSNKKGATWSVR